MSVRCNVHWRADCSRSVALFTLAALSVHLSLVQSHVWSVSCAQAHCARHVARLLISTWPVNTARQHIGATLYVTTVTCHHQFFKWTLQFFKDAYFYVKIPIFPYTLARESYFYCYYTVSQKNKTPNSCP